MTLDSDTIKSFYGNLPSASEEVRKLYGKPMSLSQKILFRHLVEKKNLSAIRRGIDYAEFSPDRVAMQDATAQMALLQFMVTGKEKSAVPATVHCDHLITGRLGDPHDLDSAINANSEVYDFLSSVCAKYGLGFWNPGAGIIHQVILENYAFPGGLIIGTDSHTPTAGGLGTIAIGVGGADASDVMAGLPWELKFPELIGVKLSGRLNGWASPKDIILKLAGLLTVKGGTDSIIEYFGEGAESLSCTGKATICNMGAETGATCSIFNFDQTMYDYLVATAREDVALLARQNSVHLTGDREVYEEPEKFFDRVVTIDLSDLEPHINGPFTPDRAIPVSRMRDEAEKNGWPLEVSSGLIGSCTNSSFEDLSRAASIITDAADKKLDLKTEFIVIPGSERVRRIAEEAGLMDLFRKAGSNIFSSACGPCIGQWNRYDGREMTVNTIVHSFNRNFAKRADGNPLTHAFVASPEIATALSIAGDLGFNPVKDTLVNRDGQAVKLKEPSGESLPRPVQGDLQMLRPQKTDEAQAGEVIIKPGSDRLQLLKPFNEFNLSNFHDIPLLIKACGKCTTDHISMAGEWLKYRGHLENISGNYMSGAVNAFSGKAGIVLDQLSKEYDRVDIVARTYMNSGIGSLVSGEENFGEGSSREHAALEPRFLGVKVIIVKSFARIHETNLKKQGILALLFEDPADYGKIREDDRFDVEGFGEFAPGSIFILKAKHADGSVELIRACHTYNKNQIAWFKAGSALNLIRKSNLER